MFWMKDPSYQIDIEDITSQYLRSEDDLVSDLTNKTQFCYEDADKIRDKARELTQTIRDENQAASGVAGLVQQYDLSTDEGIVLMCVAEALLRIPDAQTEKLLISDKLSDANWEKHLGVSESSFVNMSTWGLAVSGKILSTAESTSRFKNIWRKMLKKSSEGLIRQAVRRAVKLMSEEFVLGRTITEALKKGKRFSKLGYAFSFDMLGEAAMTRDDATNYFRAYADAIETLARHVNPKHSIFQRPGISVKLSALYPRYEFIHQEKAIDELSVTLKQLALRARDLGIALTVDAEEAERLDMSLQIFKRVFVDVDFAEWEGLGLAVQAYQKRAYAVIEWLIRLSKEQGRRIQCRLVKGAYWDTEIKHAQMHGWSDFPVFTRKPSTDVSYLACAKLLLDYRDCIYPKFATHNAYTVAAILTLLRDSGSFNEVEFQNLQGMGKSLHGQILSLGISCRVYAPVGSHEDLLPYLVRRLLENGANSSFVNQVADDSVTDDELLRNPLEILSGYASIEHDKIPSPARIFAGRVNSGGVNITHFSELGALQSAVTLHWSERYRAAPGHDWQENEEGKTQQVRNPANHRDVVGEVQYAGAERVNRLVDNAVCAFAPWNAKGVDERAQLIEAVADILEEQRPLLVSLLIREAGKIVTDALDEVREAVDFCRYYASQARHCMQPSQLSGYTGETDVLTLSGRGVVACISPWNFPVAIFVGQVVAALVTGNTVIAKPAEQTSLLAAQLVTIFHRAGVGSDVIQLLTGTGDVAGSALVAHAAIAAVLFTGSTQTAKIIHRQLADKDGPIVPFIAETGGMNAMVADSSALTEQLVADVITSAFGAAGQRCSALRVLLVQDDVADKTIDMLVGAMQMLTVGDPKLLVTDVGPVIDQQALDLLEEHEQYLASRATCLYKLPVSKALEGTFCSPQAHELSDLSLLTKEVFGPILHVFRYKRKQLKQVIEQVNAWGYGLTFGVHSRINSTIDEVTEQIHAGNVYVNRNTVGAVVGLQPFGGCGLSGTGPKAGGPHYLLRLCQERVVCTDTTATGGNATLMALGDD